MAKGRVPYGQNKKVGKGDRQQGKKKAKKRK